MSTAQLQLTDTETQTLESMARRTGKTTEELLHEAVARFLTPRVDNNRLEQLRQARGLWKGRQDIESLTDIRREFDREF